MGVFSDRGLVARAGGALALANIRFWPTVAPHVRTQLKRWEQLASNIKDPGLRALALDKLREERFNSEVAATLATLAPTAYRKTVIEAIVAYEVLYDYLDGLTERPTNDPLADGHELYRAFTDAIALAKPTSPYRISDDRSDGGYIATLVSAVHEAIIQLPAAEAISETAQRAALRCAEAQVRAHAVKQLGTEQVERWARAEATGTELGWRQFLAGSASSVLSVHALIAAAADKRTTAAEASEIDTVYLSICSLSTMLDSLIDYERDHEAHQPGYLRYYDNHGVLADDLAGSAHRAVTHAAHLYNGAHHIMTLVGVAAYYLSAPTADTDHTRPVSNRICRELQPLMTPTLTVMRLWRAAKHAHAKIRPASASNRFPASSLPVATTSGASVGAMAPEAQHARYDPAEQFGSPARESRGAVEEDSGPMAAPEIQGP